MRDSEGARNRVGSRPAFWHRAGKMVPDKPRSESQRQRRLITRLSISIETLLRIRLGLQSIPDLRHSLPIRPPVVAHLLRRLAEGASDLELLHTYEEHDEQ